MTPEQIEQLLDELRRDLQPGAWPNVDVTVKHYGGYVGDAERKRFDDRPIQNIGKTIEIRLGTTSGDRVVVGPDGDRRSGFFPAIVQSDDESAYVCPDCGVQRRVGSGWKAQAGCGPDRPKCAEAERIAE